VYTILFTKNLPFTKLVEIRREITLFVEEVEKALLKLGGDYLYFLTQFLIMDLSNMLLCNIYITVSMTNLSK
jgi:hypothetical protein